MADVWTSASVEAAMDAKPKVAVLLSCYNGEKYLVEQIESLLTQTGVSVDVYARNDGSSDRTAQILAGFASASFHVLDDCQNVGVASSFCRCLEAAYPHADYYAFCDQDDVWHADKLACAVAALETMPKNQGPRLYCSEYYYCDEELNRTAKSHLNRRGVTFDLSLFETICSGNTQVFDGELARLMLQAQSDQMGLHDAWSTLIAAGMGDIYFDDEATLEYRRLTASVSPSGKGGLALLGERVRRFLMGDGLDKIKRQNSAFLVCYGSLLPDERRTALERFCRGGRLKKMTYPHRLRQTTADDVALRLLFLIGKL